MKNKTVRLIVILITIFIIIDQASKILAINLVDGSNVKNIFIMTFVLIIVIRFIKNQIELIDTKTAIALSMVLAGGLGNLIDRIFRGAVLDFIKIYKFPIFNIADVLVFIGAVLLVIFLVIFTRKIEV